MNVEATIRESILCYPRISPTGGEVLHHLLFVIGNGFEWRNGEIVDQFPEENEPWKPSDEDRDEDRLFDLSVLPEEFQARWAERTQNDIAALQKIVDEVDTRWNDYTINREEFYPQSEYALIMNVPDDVTDDWAEAVKWGREVASQNGWKF